MLSKISYAYLFRTLRQADLDVMLKANLFTSQNLRYKSFSLIASIPKTIVLKAFVSTNTAIHRGIRESNVAKGRSRTKYSEDRKKKSTPKSRKSAARSLSRAKQEYPGAIIDFGSKDSGDREERFTFSAERKSTGFRSDFGSKYSGNKKGGFSAEQKYPEASSATKKGKFSAEQKYSEARSDFGSKYSGERKGRVSAKQKYPEARTDFGSKYTGNKKGGFSAGQKYPEPRSDFGSKYGGDKNGRFSEPDTFSPEQINPGARSNTRSKYNDDSKGRFSSEPRTFDVEQKYPGSNISDLAYKFKYNGDSEDRKEGYSAVSHVFNAEKKDPGAKTIEQYNGERKGRFSPESRKFAAERYPEANRSQSGFKPNEDRKGIFSSKQAYPRVNEDNLGSKYGGDRKSRFSAELRTFTAELKNSRQTPPKTYHSEEQDLEGIRGSAALEKRRRTPMQEGYRQGETRESGSFWIPRSSTDQFENRAERSGVFRIKVPTSAPSTITRNSQQESGANYERPREPNGQESSNFAAYRKDPPSPVEVHGMDVKSVPPRGIPYTTSASEFLYGTSVVTAALKLSRRKLYKLYIYAGENRSPTSQDATVRKLALAQNVEVVNVTGNWLRLLDRMSDGRPHNGYILEASSLPTLPVTGLQRVHSNQRALNVSLDHQSREEEAINGTSQNFQYQPKFSRYPFVLFLDGVLDPGNLGAIIRSAFLIGVDAIAVCKRATAPLSAVTLKASAGAAESLPLLSVDKPADFIAESRLNGWKTFAAELPQYTESRKRGSFTNHSLGRPILSHPCLLMVGGEGKGLSWPLQKKAEFTVSVEGARMGEGGVDSFNVSVAAAMLCDAFMGKEEVQPNRWRPKPEQIGTQEAVGGDDQIPLDDIGHDLNEHLGLESDVIPDPIRDEEVDQTRDPSLGEEEEEEGGGGGAAVEELEAIDETKAHHSLDDESVSAPKNRLF